MKKRVIIFQLIFLMSVSIVKMHLAGSSQEEKFPLSFDLKEESREIKILIKRKKRETNGTSLGCTLGELYVNDEYFCYTLERPFDDSEDFISSVPPGKYKAKLRYKDGKQEWRIQLESTSTYIFDQHDPFIMKGKTVRSGIQIHSGTRPEHTKGCILVGEQGPKTCQLARSRETFAQLLEKYFGSNQNPTLNKKITVTIQENYKEN